jgi:hypothetical protein
MLGRHNERHAGGGRRDSTSAPCRSCVGEGDICCRQHPCRRKRRKSTSSFVRCASPATEAPPCLKLQNQVVSTHALFVLEGRWHSSHLRRTNRTRINSRRGEVWSFISLRGVAHTEPETLLFVAAVGTDSVIACLTIAFPLRLLL